MGYRTILASELRAGMRIYSRPHNWREIEIREIGELESGTLILRYAHGEYTADPTDTIYVPDDGQTALF